MSPRRAVLALLLAGAAGPAVSVSSADGEDQALLADADYAAGRRARQAGDWTLALRHFQAALQRFPEAADLHNELGHTHRQLHQMAPAFDHYRRALAIDPRHLGAHEYIGEAYLAVGDLGGAERHRDALRSICLLPCEALQDLERAIAAYLAAHPTAR